MVRGARGSRVVSLVLVGAALSLGVATVGCRTTKDDIDRWANTQQGPRKLVAVLTHDKYPIELRVDAAVTLIKMKPRSGRRVGIQGLDDQPGLIDALGGMPPAERAQIVSRLVPILEEEMLKPPPPAAQAGQAPPVDTSIPYKDAAFALLTHDTGSLVTDDAERKRLRAALVSWSMADFATRMDDASQMFGLEQVLRELKADGVRKLPDLIEPNARKIDRMSELVAELGDEETRLRASQKLVEIAKAVDSEEWLKQKAPAVEGANKASKLNPTPAQFKAQLDQYQEEELLKVFSSMKKVGKKPVVDYLLGYAQNKNNAPKRRASGLAALEANLDRGNAAHAEALLKIASSNEEDDSVRDVALRRVGELPRKVVVEKLYALFGHSNWKVRWVAAELVLKMSDTSQLDEFMRNIGRAEGMAISEPLRYGALIGDMKGATKPQQLVDRYVGTGNPAQVRLSAFGFYYNRGNKADISRVQRYTGDKQRVPECKADAQECEWKCTVTKAGKPEEKEVTNVGEFVEYCVIPAMERRTVESKK
ncbi:MAG TPA: hypothetical protein VI072_25395 [Polyangiaceae bacterium]